MKRKEYGRKYVSIDSIIVWKDNPRHGNVEDEKKAIEKLFNNIKKKEEMYNLAKDICEEGFAPYDMPILVPIKLKSNKYYAYEGNRRMAAIKSVLYPSFLDFDPQLKCKFEELNGSYGGEISNNIFCVIMDHDSAVHSIEKIHSGEQQGVGRKKWGAFEKKMFNATFKNQSSDIVNIVKLVNGNKDEDILKKMDSTNIERIFSNKEIKDILKTEDYSNISQDDSSTIIRIIDIANEIADDRKSSVSRIFNKQKNITDYLVPIIKEKLLPERTEYILRANDVMIKQNDEFCFENLKLEIYDRESEVIKFNKNDINISYFDPTTKKNDILDTSVSGIWEVLIQYRECKIRRKIEIQEVVVPEIHLKKNKIIVGKEETIDLYKNIKRAKDSLKKNVINKVLITSIGDKKAKIEKNIFLNSNEEGVYQIKYELCDDNSPNISSVLEILVKESIEVLKAKNKSYKYVFTMESLYNTKIDISNTVNRLVNQLSSLDVSKYDTIICTSLRAVIELTVDEVISRKNINVEYKGKKDKLLIRTETIFDEIKKNISEICNRATTKLNYHTINNIISNIQIDKMLNMLNIGVHKSSKSIVMPEILELANKKIAIFLVLVHYYLEIN